MGQFMNNLNYIDFYITSLCYLYISDRILISTTSGGDYFGSAFQRLHSGCTLNLMQCGKEDVLSIVDRKWVGNCNSTGA